MTWTKNSSNWANGDVPDEADLDAYEDGIYRAHIMADLAGLGIGKLSQTASGPSLLMLLFHKASAFTFGTAPVTSAGFLRTPGGGPWGADSVSGLTYDRTVTGSSSNATAANTLVDNQLYLFPAFNASITVTALQVSLSLVFRITDNAYTATLDKVGLQVVKIAADGTESNVGSQADVTSGSTNGEESYVTERLHLAVSGLSQAIATTERLGFRIKGYGHSSNAAASITIKSPTDFTPGDFSTAYTQAWQTKGTPVAVWFT